MKLCNGHMTYPVLMDAPFYCPDNVMSHIYLKHSASIIAPTHVNYRIQLATNLNSLVKNGYKSC